MQNRDTFPQVSKSDLPTIWWLLSCLSNHLGCFLGIVCKHIKYGRLLYRKNGDILKAQSSALGIAHQTEKNSALIHREYNSIVKCTHTTSSNKLSDDAKIEACTSLNLRSLKQAKKLIDTYHCCVQPLTLRSLSRSLILCWYNASRK